MLSSAFTGGHKRDKKKKIYRERGREGENMEGMERKIMSDKGHSD